MLGHIRMACLSTSEWTTWAHFLWPHTNGPLGPGYSAALGQDREQTLSTGLPKIYYFYYIFKKLSNCTVRKKFEHRYTGRSLKS